MGLIPGSRRYPGEGNGKNTPVLLPGEFHGQRSLVAIIHGVEKSQTQLIWHLYSTFITSERFLFFSPLYKQLQWAPIYADNCFEDEICYKAYEVVPHQQGFLA